MRNVWLGLLCVFYAASSHAAPVTYNFTGTVNQVGTNVAVPITVGEQIPIAITVETAYPSSGGGNYAYNGSFNPSFPSQLVLSATFNGVDNDGLFQNITVMPNLDFQIHTTSPQVAAGFDFLLSGATPGALSTTALPLSLDPSQFSIGTFLVTEAFSAASYGFSGMINGLAVPEPTSIAVIVIGLLGLGVVRRPRRGALRRLGASETQVPRRR